MSQYPLFFTYAAALKFGQLAKAKNPFRKLKALTGFRPADFRPRIGLKLGLTDPVCGLNMGETAELIAREAGVTREMQDQFALESHRKALAAQAKLAEEMIPVYSPAFPKACSAG